MIGQSGERVPGKPDEIICCGNRAECRGRGRLHGDVIEAEITAIVIIILQLKLEHGIGAGGGDDKKHICPSADHWNIDSIKDGIGAGGIRVPIHDKLIRRREIEIIQPEREQIALSRQSLQRLGNVSKFAGFAESRAVGTGVNPIRAAAIAEGAGVNNTVDQKILGIRAVTIESPERKIAGFKAAVLDERLAQLQRERPDLRDAAGEIRERDIGRVSRRQEIVDGGVDAGRDQSGTMGR